MNTAKQCPACQQPLQICGEVSAIEDYRINDVASYNCTCNPKQLFILVADQLQRYDPYNADDNPRTLLKPDEPFTFV